MKRKFGKMTAVLLVFVIVALMIPITTMTVSATSNMTLRQLQAKFPAGKYWNHAGSSTNNPDGYTDTPCYHHGSCDYYGRCGCNSAGNSIQCFGFANKLAYDAYGSYYTSWSKTTLSNLKAGDVIRYKNDGHSIFVTGIDSDTITYGDCNSDGHCIIRWGATISKSTVAATLTGVYSAPSELTINDEPEQEKYIDIGTNFTANLIKANDWSTIVNKDTNVEIQYGYGNANEYWWFEKQGDGSYTIKSLEDGKYLDVSEAGSRNGLNIHVYEYTGADNQKWFVKDSSFGKVLVPKCALNSCLDVENDGSSNGTNVQLWEQNGSAAQGLNIYKQPTVPNFKNIGSNFAVNLIKANDWSTIVNKDTNVEIQYGYGNANEYWWLVRQNDGTYTFKSLEDGKYLDVSEAGNRDGLNIHVYEYTGADNQKWYITDGPYGNRLIPKCAINSCLDVDNDGATNGTNVQLWTQNDTPAQGINIYSQSTIPEFENIGDDFYCQIKAFDNNKLIINNNTNVELGECEHQKAEYWRFIRQKDGSYTIKSIFDDKYLDVSEAGNQDGLNIHVYSFTGAKNQKWYIEKNNNYYFLIPLCAPNSCLDINNGEFYEGNNVQLWSRNYSNAQKIDIMKVELQIGDTNLDGNIDICDATAIQRHLVELEPFNGEQLAVADTNADGEINISDATHLQMYLAEFDVKLG